MTINSVTKLKNPDKYHGYSNANSRIHVIWSNMKRRCLNPSGSEKRKYKGVSVCDEWIDFMPFKRWAESNGYTDNLTIDRIDSSGNYEPNNCRWASYNTQSANRKKTNKNKSGYIGVSASGGRWRATVQWKGAQVYHRYFDSRVDAAVARDEYVVQNKLPHTLNFSDAFERFVAPFEERE